MLNLQRILGSRLARAVGGVGLLAAAAACGQRGPLYLPTEPAAANRATLPQVLVPALPREGGAAKDTEATPSQRPASPSSPAPSEGTR